MVAVTHGINCRLCGNCQTYLPDDQPCQKSICQGVTKDPDDHFLELPIDMQIKGLFESKSLHISL